MKKTSRDQLYESLRQAECAHDMDLLDDLKATILSNEERIALIREGKAVLSLPKYVNGRTLLVHCFDYGEAEHVMPDEEYQRRSSQIYWDMKKIHDQIDKCRVRDADSVKAVKKSIEEFRSKEY